MVKVDGAGPAVDQEPPRWASGSPRVGRSLERQARLVAVACLLVDAVVFADATSTLPLAVRLGGIVVVIIVDAALALPARYSGWVAVAHAVAAVGLAVVLRGTPEADLGLVGGLIAAYRAGAWLHGRGSVGAVLVLAASAAISQAVVDPTDALTGITEMMKDACIPWLVGRYTSARRGYISELRHNRENAARDAAAEVERAVDGERATIARDLHDVISHHVSAIGVHAGAARINLAARPDRATPAIMDSLTAVESSSRAAMSDLGRMVEILHGTSDSTNQSGLGNLDELFDGMRCSGTAMRFTISGAPRRLSGSLDIALYRVVQEMLTNARRYGDGTTVAVALEYRPDAVVLTARNGIGARPEHGDRPSTGRGLVGIRSRAALFGGTVTHGPDATGTTWETRVSVSDGAVPQGGAP